MLTSLNISTAQYIDITMSKVIFIHILLIILVNRWTFWTKKFSDCPFKNTLLMITIDIQVTSLQALKWCHLFNITYRKTKGNFLWFNKKTKITTFRHLACTLTCPHAARATGRNQTFCLSLGTSGTHSIRQASSALFSFTSLDVIIDQVLVIKPLSGMLLFMTTTW